SGPADAVVRLWDVRPGGGARVLKGGSELVSVAFAPDGKLVVGAGRGFVNLWDARTGQERLRLHHGAAPCGACFTPDGKAVASGGGYQVILWDALSGKRRWAVEARGHVNSVA